jgi:hypothetical protein
VAGRALAFADPDIIRMATQDYVAVTGDDWYQRRRQDAEGEFFRKVADQGPRKGEGGSTRQGIYCFTADGQLLVYKNAGQAPDVMRETLQRGLAEFKRLAAERRKPGAVQVGDQGRFDPSYVRTPPPNGLIIDVYTRILDRDGKGELCQGTCSVRGGDKAARDHLWITESEWKPLVQADPKLGDRFPLPSRIAERIARFHLLDNTRGEPPMWRHEDIRKSEMALVAEKADRDNVLLRLEGSVLLATNADLAKADRGYEARLLGYVAHDGKNITRFDLVAVGDHWGEGTYTRNARPGRQPLGVAFELARGDRPSDKVPPQAAREIGAYVPR